MFSKISWPQFVSTAIFLLAIYYISIIILYYRHDIMRWAAHGITLGSANKNISATLPIEAPRPMSYNELTVAATEQSLQKINYAEVHELMEELKTIFASASKKKIVKQELILAIQNKLKDYVQLKGAEIENEITQHIKNECKEKCAVCLGSEDLKNLWKL